MTAERIITIDVAERGDRHGMFVACLDGRELCASRQPFLDAARVLLAEGVSPQARLVMRHARTGTESLAATVGAAAKLVVAESGRGFRKWSPWSPLEGFAAADGTVKDALETAGPHSAAGNAPVRDYMRKRCGVVREERPA